MESHMSTEGDGYRVEVVERNEVVLIELTDLYLDDVAAIVEDHGDHPKMFVDPDDAERLAGRLLDAVAVAREHIPF
jgi:hypothetical protein